MKYVQEKTYHNNGLLHPYALYIKKKRLIRIVTITDICVTNSVGRVLSSVIKKIEVVIKAEISEEDMEFTAGKSCLDNIFRH